MLTVVTLLYLNVTQLSVKFSVGNLILKQETPVVSLMHLSQVLLADLKASRSYTRKQPVPTLNRCALYN
jgi:hypothetical protein